MKRVSFLLFIDLAHHRPLVSSIEEKKRKREKRLMVFVFVDQEFLQRDKGERCRKKMERGCSFCLSSIWPINFPWYPPLKRKKEKEKRLMVLMFVDQEFLQHDKGEQCKKKMKKRLFFLPFIDLAHHLPLVSSIEEKKRKREKRLMVFVFVDQEFLQRDKGERCRKKMKKRLFFLLFIDLAHHLPLVPSFEEKKKKKRRG